MMLRFMMKGGAHQLAKAQKEEGLSPRLRNGLAAFYLAISLQQRNQIVARPIGSSGDIEDGIEEGEYDPEHHDVENSTRSVLLPELVSVEDGLEGIVAGNGSPSKQEW